MRQLREVAEYSRVIFVNGPRQAGKTTLPGARHRRVVGYRRSLPSQRRTDGANQV